MRTGFFPAIILLILSSCSVQQKISRQARETVLKDPALKAAHIGVSVYDPQEGRFLYNYQGDKYFIPASNTKIPTCYAAMKYLGDSLIAARLQVIKGNLHMIPGGDPSFLHPDFTYQPLLEKLKPFQHITIISNWQAKPLGSGWSWNDFNENYMAERSALPMYGNLIRFKWKGDTMAIVPRVPIYVHHQLPVLYQEPLSKERGFSIERELGSNIFVYQAQKQIPQGDFSIPFATDNRFIEQLLKDTLQNGEVQHFYYKTDLTHFTALYSLPTDSILKSMMHNSDNFFAEQALMMVSQEMLGLMSDAKIIDTILKTDFADLPQKPRWVDGSGLSRYNLFTPGDMVMILNKMKNEFGMERIRDVFATGNEGTLFNYYKEAEGSVYAKTGTLSGVVALSGFLYTRKNKLLLFSVLVNNHQSSATAIRKVIEKFILGLRED